VHFLGLVQVGCERPFDEDVFSGEEGGHEECVVSVYAHGADNEVDVWVVGEIFRAAVGFGIRREVVALDGEYGGLDA
jgi:hypothetical protein